MPRLELFAVEIYQTKWFWESGKYKLHYFLYCGRFLWIDIYPVWNQWFRIFGKTVGLCMFSGVLCLTSLLWSCLEAGRFSKCPDLSCCNWKSSRKKSGSENLFSVLRGFLWMRTPMTSTISETSDSEFSEKLPKNYRPLHVLGRPLLHISSLVPGSWTFLKMPDLSCCNWKSTFNNHKAPQGCLLGRNIWFPPPSFWRCLQAKICSNVISTGLASAVCKTS